MIPTQLIENALSLTGENIKKWEYLDIEPGYYPSGVPDNKKKIAISMPRFCYYLLSESFIEKYADNILGRGHTYTPHNYVKDFSIAIYEYQSGQEQPLISLLEKIGHNQQ